MKRRTALVLLTSGLGILLRAGGVAAGLQTDVPAAVPMGTSDAVDPASTRALRNVRSLGSNYRVHSIEHVAGVYRVLTADGSVSEFPEASLRFKVDSSNVGPARGRPVILPAGPFGDRAWVIFARADEIGAFITPES